MGDDRSTISLQRGILPVIPFEQIHAEDRTAAIFRINERVFGCPLDVYTRKFDISRASIIAAPEESQKISGLFYEISQKFSLLMKAFQKYDKQFTEASRLLNSLYNERSVSAEKEVFQLTLTTVEFPRKVA